MKLHIILGWDVCCSIWSIYYRIELKRTAYNENHKAIQWLFKLLLLLAHGSALVGLLWILVLEKVVFHSYAELCRMREYELAESASITNKGSFKPKFCIIILRFFGKLKFKTLFCPEITVSNEIFISRLFTFRIHSIVCNTDTAFQQI